MLTKIVSGGQSGCDRASWDAAKACGLQTGGTMPKNFMTLDGPRPEYANLYGAVESYSSSYALRTEQNVIDSDATLRLYTKKDSPGEKCTFRHINRHKKLFFDVNLNNPPDPQTVADWIEENGISVLNCAGNSEKSSPGIGEKAASYLKEVFLCLGLREKK